MKVCVYCKTRYRRGSGVSFHKFPSEPLKRLWVENMKLVNFVPKSSHYLCSKHFTEECMYKQYSRTSVNKNCVPTLFSEIEIEQNCDESKIGMNMNKEKMLQFKSEPVSNKPIHTCPGHRTVVTPTVTTVTTLRVKKEPVSNSIYSFDHDTSSNDSTAKRPKTISELWDDVKHDHSYDESCITSSTKLKRVQKALENSRASVKTLSQRVKRLQFSVSRLKTDLRNKKKMDKECFYLKRVELK